MSMSDNISQPNGTEARPNTHTHTHAHARTHCKTSFVREFLTILADQEVQVAVGVGHANLGLHLGSLQGGVDLARTALLRHRL